MSVPCKVCGQPCPPKKPRQQQKVICSPECWKADVSARMAATNRQHASARMLVRNPMAKPEIREKMAATLRAIGHRPIVQGGNGKPLRVPQAALLAALGDGWVSEYGVRTYAKRGTLPGVYKIDIAHPVARVGIEVDGGSHGSKARQEQDNRKDTFLRGAGWTVLRFTNAAVMGDLEGCVQMVLSTTLRWNSTTTTSPVAS